MVGGVSKESRETLLATGQNSVVVSYQISDGQTEEVAVVAGTATEDALLKSGYTNPIVVLCSESREFEWSRSEGIDIEASVTIRSLDCSKIPVELSIASVSAVMRRYGWADQTKVDYGTRSWHTVSRNDGADLFIDVEEVSKSQAYENA